MSKLQQKSFRQMSQFSEFQQIPCVSLKDDNIPPIGQPPKQKQFSTLLPPRQDAQSREYIQYLKQKGQKQLKEYVKLLIIKTSCFGLMIGLLILALLYDKIFFSTHYYMRTRQYQQGQLGIDFKHRGNLPNYQLGAGHQFSIQSKDGHNVWDPQNTPAIYDPNAYHEIKSETKKDKYDLEGYIMEQLILPEKKGDLGEYDFAVKLLEVNHNVNFKGELKAQATKYQKTDEDLKKKEKRLENILSLQKEWYQTKYSISQYTDNQLPFCVVVPSYNNIESRLYLRNLDSIFMQDYQNYHVVYIDDASPDKTGEYVKKYVQDRLIPKDKIEVITNVENMLAMANLYNAITNHCKSGEIVMLVDGDDSLLGRQVMSLFNAVYQKNKAGLVYSRYLLISNNDRAGLGGSSRQIPKEYLQQERFRELRGFFTSHLLTFYADLFWKVKKQDLTYKNGTFFKFAYDVALITPIIEMVNPRIVFIEQTTYEYRYDTGINDPGWGQIQVDDIVFAKPKYKRLTEFPFIDKFYEKENKQQKIQPKA